MAVTVSGTEALLADLERMIPTDTNVDDALSAGGEPVKEAMKRLAPVGETGNLKEAINVGGVRNSRRGRTVTVGVHRRDIDLSAKGGEYYPAFVEYGHGGPRPAPPHPFIRPGFDLARDAAWGIIKQTVINQLKEKGL